MRSEHVPYRSVMKTGGEVGASIKTIEDGVIGRLMNPSFPRPPILLVCSAPGVDPEVQGSIKITQSAIAAIQFASEGRINESQRSFEPIHSRFMAMLAHFNISSDACERMLSQYFERILEGEAHAGTPELIMAKMLSDIIPNSVLLRPADYLQLDNKGQLLVHHGATKRFKLRNRLGENRIGIMGGFVVAGPDGRATTLSRGGSDASAGGMAKLLNAPCVIYTNTRGIMSADPAIVGQEKALLIEDLTIDELAQATLGGTYVVHEQTIPPIRDINGQLLVKNYIHPSGGTKVMFDRKPDTDLAKIVTGTRDRRVITVFQYGVNAGSGFVNDIAGVIAQAKLPIVDLASDTNSVSVTTADTGVSLDEVEANLKRMIPGAIVTIPETTGLASVSIIGNNIRKETSEILARAGRALADIDVPIRMTSSAYDSNNITLYVPREAFEHSVKAVHQKIINE